MFSFLENENIRVSLFSSLEGLNLMLIFVFEGRGTSFWMILLLLKGSQRLKAMGCMDVLGKGREMSSKVLTEEDGALFSCSLVMAS